MKIIKRMFTKIKEDGMPLSVGLSIVALVIIIVIIIGANIDWPESTTSLTLKGKHELRRMKTVHETEGKISGSFFIFGSINGSLNQNFNVYFSWKMNDNKTYALSKLPMQKIRIQMQPGLTTPTIEFVLRGGCLEGDTISEMFRWDLQYAIITCSPDDWEPNIEMPLGN